MGRFLVHAPRRAVSSKRDIVGGRSIDGSDGFDDKYVLTPVETQSLWLGDVDVHASCPTWKWWLEARLWDTSVGLFIINTHGTHPCWSVCLGFMYFWFVESLVLEFVLRWWSCCRDILCLVFSVRLYYMVFPLNFAIIHKYMVVCIQWWRGRGLLLFCVKKTFRLMMACNLVEIEWSG